jgi:dihydrofolate reductase/thymidylate synthase
MKISKEAPKLYYNMIVAVSKNKGIGLKGKMPWNIPNDMKHFKDVTSKVISTNETFFQSLNNNFTFSSKEFIYQNMKDKFAQSNKKNLVIMGRNTWDSLPEKFQPLPDRINVILSSNEKFHKKISNKNNKELFTADSIDSVFKLANELKIKNLMNEIFVIGGSKVYAEFLENYPELCKVIFQTNIEKEYESDTFFNTPKEFQPLFVSKTQTESKDPDTTYDYRILFNKNLVNDKKFSNNLENLINPYFLNKYPKHEEYQYLEAMKDIIETGEHKKDRTGVGTISKFGARLSFDCSETFPLLTTKDTFWRGIVEELIWFIKGDTNAKHLQDKKIHIWDGNSSREYLDSIGLKDREVGDLGPVYGFQWRHFGAQYKTMHDDYTGKGVDQLKEIIHTIKNNPTSRRIIMSAWNPTDLKIMALPPCHVMCQFYVEKDKLNLQMYQRSGDMGLGIPFNIASYSLLLYMVSHITGLKPGKFVHIIGDAHVYSNHVEPIKKQLLRTPKPFPILKINREVKDIEDFKLEDFTLVNYSHHPKIKMDMAV